MTEKGLIKLPTFVKSYNPSLVQELYNNLSPEIKTSTTRGYQNVFVRGWLVEFSPKFINKFPDFPTEIEDEVFEEGFEYIDEVLKEITGGKCNSWGHESRLSASLLTVKYSVLFKLGICNWFPTTHNSSILRAMALLLYSIVTGVKFNLGQFIFEKIIEEATISAIMSHDPTIFLKYNRKKF